MTKKIKNYVSETDQLLEQFAKQHPEPTASQQQEIAKHARIAKRRDQDIADDVSSEIWEDF